MRKSLLGIAILVAIFLMACMKTEIPTSANKWSNQRANDWYKSKPWMIGANFIPSTAINQLEMWQAETFDTATINRELGWAESIGFNTMRVYLHHKAWQIDSSGFKLRLNQYLSIADKHNIKTIFVFFDDCWNARYKAGKQPDPKPGIHNSGWLQDPGDSIFLDPLMMPILQNYVVDILQNFKTDNRIVLWDLYNEPGNSSYNNASMPLLRNVFAWARSVNPSQPLSSAVWHDKLNDLNKFQLENSDVITYHNYANDTIHKHCIDTLRKYNRPLLCSEYMARNQRSLFSNITPLLKKENVCAINWGLVSGKTNTIYGWNDPIPDGSEPKLWFHDIFRKDGTPYLTAELAKIKQLTGRQ